MIDSSEVIDSPEKLLASNKILNFYDGDKDLFFNAPHGSYLKKLIVRKQYFMLSSQMSEESKKRYFEKTFDSFIFFGPEISITYFLSFVCSRAYNLISFIDSTVYYEKLVAFYMRANLAKAKKTFIHNR